MDNNNNNNNNNNDNHIDNVGNFPGARQPILLNPEGQQLFDVLKSYINSELPPYTNSKMNEMINNMAEEEGEFVPTVRKSIVDLFFRKGITDEQRGLTTTIADKEEWPKEEKRYEIALRLFPNILSEQVHGFYLIQWISFAEVDGTYNLKNVSLIPMVTKLSVELQRFGEGLRGGLLSIDEDGFNTLQHIICYCTNNGENNELVENCFLAVWKWMRENNYLLMEDIREYNLIGKLFVTDTGLLSESRLRYLIDMDPVALSLPCRPEYGNFLPIHWSPLKQSIQIFSFVLKVGMQHYPEKFGFIFGEGIHRNSNNRKQIRLTPYQAACKKYGQEKVTNEVINCIKEYCSSTTFTTNATTTNIMEASLLMSAITEETIHIDGLYILLRKDPEAAFLMLQQNLSGQTVTDTDTNSNSNNKNTNGASNNNATSCAFNSTLSSISTTETITTTVSSSTTNNNNNNNNNNNDDNDNRDNGYATSSSPTHQGKKRKQHDRL